VGVHLADQLLIPMALAGGGSMVTVEPSPHTRTNMDVLRRFLAVEVEVGNENGAWTIEVHAKGGKR
jgi:RNA 3'-terminal phosphate cyclase (ATP)